MQRITRSQPDSGGAALGGAACGECKTRGASSEASVVSWHRCIRPKKKAGVSAECRREMADYRLGDGFGWERALAPRSRWQSSACCVPTREERKQLPAMKKGAGTRVKGSLVVPCCQFAVQSYSEILCVLCLTLKDFEGLFVHLSLGFIVDFLVLKAQLRIVNLLPCEMIFSQSVIFRDLKYKNLVNVPSGKCTLLEYLFFGQLFFYSLHLYTKIRPFPQRIRSLLVSCTSKSRR